MACGSLCAGRKAEGEVGGVRVAFESEEWVFDVEEKLWKSVGERAGRSQQRWEHNHCIFRSLSRGMMETYALMPCGDFVKTVDITVMKWTTTTRPHYDTTCPLRDRTLSGREAFRIHALHYA